MPEKKYYIKWVNQNITGFSRTGIVEYHGKRQFSKTETKDAIDYFKKIDPNHSTYSYNLVEVLSF